MSDDRIYTAMFDNVTVSAVQDVFSLKAGAANGIVLHHIMISAGGVTAAAEIRLRLKRLPATVTIGSGGSAPTVQFADSGDTKASTLTNLRANDTTQATTSGTAQILLPWQWNVLNFFEHLPVPEDREHFAAAEACVLDIAATPGAATILSGWIKWAEVP
jgi:hypothetical protein